MSRTSYNTPAVRPTWRARLGGGLLALVLLPALASAQNVGDKHERNRDRNSQFNLAAGPTTVLQVNQYQCGLVNDGATCTDVFDSPTGGGGFWPTGSPNQYMFNSGLQIVGIIPMSDDCTTANKGSRTEPDCFSWSGDTTGAFFFDASGLRQHGTALTDIYDSLDPEDLENWPAEGSFPNFPTASAYVQDTSLFNDVLIGRRAASQQDSWVMYWDGDPTQTGGRTHPMGILVEQRSLAWNYPDGNENVIYFIYKFTNVTNNTLFQQMNETRYAISLPDAGWRIDSIYVAYAADPDVTSDAGQNYSTAILPFNMGVAYKDNFLAPEFIYPPNLFYPPFFQTSPGLVAMQYLKSPIDPATGREVGLTSFSLTTRDAAGGFQDPSTVARGWRYISLNVDAGKGDANCTFGEAEVRERRSCFLSQTPTDVRMFVGSGPFSLDPGASATIAVAQYAAATVNQTGTVVPGSDNPPLYPTPQPGCMGQPIRPIERAAGLISVPVCPPDGEQLDLLDVNVIDKSLLGRAQIAQSIFNNKFLLGFAPEAPPFYLVPGDNRITVVWEPSPTEDPVTGGDPFFAAAGDPNNPLYDPNYREFDVEGYRIYRGTSPANLQLVAQFDKNGTTFEDNLCVLDPSHVSTEPCTEVEEYDIVHPFVQYTNVVELASGDPQVLAADTAHAGQIAAGTSGPMENTGIPFNYIDTDVRNGFQYFYRVTAFDINSIVSGPSSLESAGAAKSAVPTAPASSLTSAEFQAGLFGRGQLLTGANHTISSSTGMFSGPSAPTNSFDIVFAAFAPQLLQEGSFAVRLDSILPAYYGGQYFFTNTVTGEQVTFGGTAQNSIAQIISGGDADVTFELPVVSLASDPTVRQDLRDQGVDAPPLAGALNSTFTLSRFHFNSADADWAYEQPGFWGIDPPNTEAGGSRWFAGANESTPDPTLGDGTAGALPGVTVWRPTPYTVAAYGSSGGDLFRRFQQATWALHRSADMRVYWGAAGIDSVIDVTHNVPVEFSTHLRATWGFIGDNDNNGTLNWGDITYVSGTQVVPNISRTPKVNLSRTPVVAPTDVTGDNTADGSGFAILITGEPFFFQGEVPTNTVWTLRTYNGSVTRTGGGVYAFTPTLRNGNVPGLVAQVDVSAAAQIVAAEADLSRVHTVPDPYYVASIFDLSPSSKELQFVNLPAEATVRIYSLSGILVDVVTHNDPAGSGIARWNLRNRSNQFVASGVYLFHVSTPDGKSAVGKFTVVNSGIAR